MIKNNPLRILLPTFLNEILRCSKPPKDFIKLGNRAVYLFLSVTVFIVQPPYLENQNILNNYQSSF